MASLLLAIMVACACASTGWATNHKLSAHEARLLAMCAQLDGCIDNGMSIKQVQQLQAECTTSTHSCLLTQERMKYIVDRKLGGKRPDDWVFAANKRTCWGYNKYDNRVKTVADCAKKCRGASTMFAYGTNEYGKDRCNQDGCKCCCERDASPLATCDQKEDSGFNLYAYNGKWQKVSDKAECKGAEELVEYMPTIEACAAKCRGVSSMFAYGTNKYGKNRCNTDGCKCLCEYTAKHDGTCQREAHMGYDLYKYMASGERHTVEERREAERNRTEQMTRLITDLMKGSMPSKHNPAMVQFSNFSTGFAPPEGRKLRTVAHSLVEGKSMLGGKLHLKNGESFITTTWYEMFIAVHEGILLINDIENKITKSLLAGSVMHIKRGTKIELRGYVKAVKAMWVAQSNGPEISDILNDEIAKKPKFGKIFNDIPGWKGKRENAKMENKEIPWFNNTQKSESYLIDLLVTTDPGREMAGGLYELNKGPALDYTYEYEEFKYIVAGEFHLTDGTGQFVKAKAGDLMYFPKGCAVHFTAPKYALGFYIGQRVGDSA